MAEGITRNKSILKKKHEKIIENVVENSQYFSKHYIEPKKETNGVKFKEISELDVSSNQEEIEAIVEEFRIDYNRDHFIRDKEFLNTWDFFDEKTRKIFIEFLEFYLLYFYVFLD